MTQDKDQMRAEFETRQFRDLFADAESRERKGHGYRYMGVDEDWDTWQAAWRAARASAQESINWNEQRWALLQQHQQMMRDPERTIVCDVMANGQLLCGPDGSIDAARYACAPLAVPASDWWRKRAEEIELQIAQTGSTEAMRCFTDMRTLMQSVASPQPTAQTCTCPSGDGSLRWPCPAHPPEQSNIGKNQ